MDFALSDEHRLLRDAARDFLTGEMDLQPLLTPGADVTATPRAALWEKMVALGWSGLTIPEALGGLGMSLVDLAMIVEETGRSLATSPLFGTLAGSWALLAAGSAAQQARLLPEVSARGHRLALGMPGDKVTASGDRLTGECALLVDPDADTFVIAAGGRYYLVDPQAVGVTVERLDWRDITREVGRVTLDMVPGEPMERTVDEAWPWIRDRLYLLLAAESAGGLQHVLDATVAYAQERVAFGRPIGAFQAIKHQLADMKGQVECASVAVLHAAWALENDADAAPLAAAIAQSYASEAYSDAAFRSIQIFGAIGFTWEMRNHLYFKRARANAVLLGAPSAQRAEIFAMLEARQRA